MNIRKMSLIGAAGIAALFLLGIVMAGLAINQIRFGGALQTRGQHINDLLADILPPPAFIIEPYLEVTQMRHDSGHLNEGRARLASLQASYQERHDYWVASGLEPALKQQLGQAAKQTADQFWLETNNVFLPAMARGDADAAAASHQRLSRLYLAHRSSIDGLVKSSKEEADRFREEVDSQLAMEIGLLVMIALLMLAAIAAATWYISQRVVSPLSDTATAMQTMAGGDYTVSVSGAERRDEIGTMVRSVEVFRAAALAKVADEKAQALVVAELATGLRAFAAGNLEHAITARFDDRYEALRQDYNGAAQELASVVGRVTEAAQSVNTGSSEISTASDDLARRTEQQAATLEETAAALDQVTNAVRQTAANAMTVSGTVATTHAEATDGARIVREVVSAMGDIESSSQEIASIIAVIDGISFQTNLLALNAGVEAARAGETGKGFAVVASEVRALAQRSADAAKEIKELVNKSSDIVNRGVSLVDQTGEMLARILDKVTEINPLVRDISTSAETQAASLGQINVAVGEIDRMTQQNAAMVEESTAAASGLSDEARQLTQLVAHFRVGKARWSGGGVALQLRAA